MTAVEWLIENLISEPYSEQDFKHNFQCWEQAKEMEKEQITDAFDEGQEYEYQYHINSAPKFDSETYYNETYKSE